MAVLVSELLRDPRVQELIGLVGAPYWWGKGDPSTPWPPKACDCSGWHQMVLVRLGILSPTEPDRTAHSLAMISNPIGNRDPKLGDGAYYGKKRDGEVHITHVMTCLGGGWAIGARGGGSKTKGDNPKAYVDLRKLDYRNDLIVVGEIKPEYRLDS